MQPARTPLFPASPVGRPARPAYTGPMAEIVRALILWPVFVAIGIIPGITPLEAVLWTPIAVLVLTVGQISVTEGVYWFRSRATWR